MLDHVFDVEEEIDEELEIQGCILRFYKSII